MQNKMITLNSGTEMPMLGYGTYLIPPGETAKSVLAAIETGYRSIDTAKAYDNESGVGQAIRNCGIDRGDLFITTKLWNSDQGYDATMRAFEKSMNRLGLTYLDLYLIHWPTPRCNNYVDTYKAMEKLHRDGRIRAIGVSNFAQAHIEKLKEQCDILPAVNQIEIHPWLTQQDMVTYLQSEGIAAEAWSPLAQGAVLGEPALVRIADKHGKSTVQVILRWNIQRNIVVIPRTTKPHRMADNAEIFDFALDDDDMRAIAAMNKNHRTGPNPDTFHWDSTCG